MGDITAAFLNVEMKAEDPDVGLEFPRDTTTQAEFYVDASFMSEGPEGVTSRAGYCGWLQPRDTHGPSGFFCAYSKAIKAVPLSTPDAELRALTECIRECIRTRGLLEEMGAPQLHPTPIGEDNQGAYGYAHNEKLTENSKHVRLQQQFVNFHQREGTADVWQVPTIVEWADQLTKTLKPTEFIRQLEVLLGHTGVPRE